jgi:hypothetical protein
VTAAFNLEGILPATNGPELNAPFLDYAVALAEGYDVRPWPELGESYWRLYLDGEPAAYIGAFRPRNLSKVRGLEHYCPSLNPVLCAEIVDREHVGTHYDIEKQTWLAWKCDAQGAVVAVCTGDTPRVAAMRCHVVKHAVILAAARAKI